tara:strand:+ start:236 stop:874 length:639 start_codon:yes stop_codon:yes gene_type:complete
MNINSKKIEEYCIEYSNQESDLIQKLKADTYRYEVAPQMICGPIVGEFLKMIIKISGVENVLEIGMFTGYSTLKMAESLPENGKIHSCEIMERHISTSKKYFKNSNSFHKIIVYPGDAINTLEEFKIESFDLIFIDADKINYPNYYHKTKGLLKLGGIVVFDNMLWGGKVLSPKDQETQAIIETAKLIKSNPKLEQLLLPVRDGIMIYRKLK